jgi:hypothetical protein
MPGEAEELLAEIRDILQEQLDEYKRVTNQSLEYQRVAVRTQQRYAKFSKVVLLVLALLLGAGIWFIVYLMQFLKALQ